MLKIIFQHINSFPGLKFDDWHITLMEYIWKFSFSICESIFLSPFHADPPYCSTLGYFTVFYIESLKFLSIHICFPFNKINVPFVNFLFSLFVSVHACCVSYLLHSWFVIFTTLNWVIYFHLCLLMQYKDKTFYGCKWVSSQFWYTIFLLLWFWRYSFVSVDFISWMWEKLHL